MSPAASPVGRDPSDAAAGRFQGADVGRSPVLGSRYALVVARLAGRGVLAVSGTLRPAGLVRRARPAAIAPVRRRTGVSAA